MASNELSVPFLSDTHLRDLTIFFIVIKFLIKTLNFRFHWFVGESRGKLVWRDRIFISLQKYDRPLPLHRFHSSSKADSINFLAACFCYQDIEQCRHTVDNMFVISDRCILSLKLD